MFLTFFAGMSAIGGCCWLGWYWWKRQITIIHTDTDFIAHNTALKAFERQLNHYYPLRDGTEFCIDHGANYMAFFSRMGTPYANLYWNWRDKTQIVGTGIAVLRHIIHTRKLYLYGLFTRNVFYPHYYPLQQSPKDICPEEFISTVWYICDLKVAKGWRGYFIPFQMLVHALVAGLYRYSTKCYAVTMNPADRIVRLATRIWTPFGAFKSAGNLLIYSVTADEMMYAAPIIKCHKGEFEYISLGGTDVVSLRSADGTQGDGRRGGTDVVSLRSADGTQGDGRRGGTDTDRTQGDGRRGGIKDLMVRPVGSADAGKPMQLLHVNFRKNTGNMVDDANNAGVYKNRIRNADIKGDTNLTYMFCFHEKDPVCTDLIASGITTNTSATILHLGMDYLQPGDWDFIQTSEI